MDLIDNKQYNEAKEEIENLEKKLQANLDHSLQHFKKDVKDIIADEIIKQHQGLLFIESTEGAGTTVTIVLPLYEPEETPEEIFALSTENRDIDPIKEKYTRKDLK